MPQADLLLKGEPGARSKLSLRELEALRAVISAGKTTAAAARLGISQPAVSRALQHLESRLGRTLFKRDGGRLVPTSEALALNERIEPIFQTLAEVENVTWMGEPIRPLRIVAPFTITDRFLTGVIARFIAAQPELRVQLEIGTSSDVVHAVADGKADLGISDGLPEHAALKLEPLLRSDAHVVLRRCHRLAAQPFLAPADFHEEPFIALTRRFPIRAVLDRLFAERGVRPRTMVEASTSLSVGALVRAGVGIGVLNPFPIAMGHDEALVFRPIRPAIAYVTAFILPANTPPFPAARQFIEFVRAGEIDDRYSQPV